jgi:hypothetical protein
MEISKEKKAKNLPKSSQKNLGDFITLFFL